MIFPTTGIAYSFLSFGLGIFAWRFFQSWQVTEKKLKRKSEAGKWLFSFFAIFTIICSITTVVALFFNQNVLILRWLVIFTSFLLTLGAAAAAYLVFYFTIPKVTPWYGFIGIFILGIITTVLSIFIFNEPFLEINGGLNWGLRPPVNFLRFSIYLVTFLPLSIIFLRQFCFTKKGDDIRIKSLALALILFIGLIVVYVDFILEPIFNLPAASSDILILFLSIILIICGLLPFCEPIKSKNKRMYYKKS